MKFCPKGVPIHMATAIPSWHWVNFIKKKKKLFMTEQFHHLLFILFFFLNTNSCHNSYKCVKPKQKHSYNPSGNRKLQDTLQN